MTDIIETERLTLRPVRSSDAGPIALYAGDERLARMTTSIPHPYPPGAAEEFVARVAGQSGIWALDATKIELGEFLGLVNLRPWPGEAPEMGYWLAPGFRGAGYMSEAVGAVAALAKETAREVRATVFQDNPASAAVLLRCGFDYVGDDEAFSVARNATVARWVYVR